VGAGPDALLGIESMLGSNRFRVDFLDKADTPYITIRQRRPDLVVLCFAPDDDEACQVLQMLQLDPATRRLPILTYVDGEACAIISSQWPRTTSGIPSASNSWGRYTAR
jgi:DNA-binding response OmpR family regulator